MRVGGIEPAHCVSKTIYKSHTLIILEESVGTFCSLVFLSSWSTDHTEKLIPLNPKHPQKSDYELPLKPKPKHGA